MYLIKKNPTKDKSGFTIIELMVVLSIIGILSAIGLSQYSTYKAVAFDSSAKSTCMMIGVTEVTLFSDWNRYGSSEAAATPGSGAQVNGSFLTGPGANLIISTTDTAGGFRGTRINISSGVQVRINLDATFTTFTAVCKHPSGETTFAVDSENVTTVYLRADGIGTELATALPVGIASTTAIDDPTGAGFCDDSCLP